MAGESSGRLKRGLFFTSGSFFVVLAVIGIFIPFLPTTPFLLLAAACYFRSSKRFYEWLLKNRLFGRYIRNYRDGKGISILAKAATLALLYATISFTALFATNDMLVRLALVLIAIGVSGHIITIKTLRSKNGRSTTVNDPRCL